MTRQRGVPPELRAYVNAAATRFARDFNSQPLEIGVVDGVVWAIARSPVVGVNGYAMVPGEKHPWSRGWPEEVDFNDVFNVHGGITAAFHPWLGFDTGHADDLWPPEFDPHALSSRLLMSPNAIHWTVSAVSAEARRLARQVAKLARDPVWRTRSRFAELDVQQLNTLEGEMP